MNRTADSAAPHPGARAPFLAAAAPPPPPPGRGAPSLAPAAPPPFEIHHPAGRRRALIVCDHASRAMPRALGRLGLPDEATWRHIAWGIGAAELPRAMGLLLDAVGGAGR